MTKVFYTLLEFLASVILMHLSLSFQFFPAFWQKYIQYMYMYFFVITVKAPLLDWITEERDTGNKRETHFNM